MFWNRLDKWGASPALITTDGSGRVVSYAELSVLVDAVAARLHLDTLSHQVILLPVANSIMSVAIYLAALRYKHVIFPFGQETDSAFFTEILALYRPDQIVFPFRLSDADCRDYKDYVCTQVSDDLTIFCAVDHVPMAVPHPELAVLLTTSGSTGNPKLVRLAADALAANARQIVQALHMSPDERCITTLSMAYSFGLSIINSHFLVGGSLVLSDRSLLEPDFWSVVEANGVTTLAGVPFSYDILRRTGADKKAPRCLIKLLQAGGRMNPKMIEWTRQAFPNAELYVMYGQTEATARLSVLPPSEADAGHGSVGYALPEGLFSTDSDGQVIYDGPNVMMGYACQRADLATPDTLGGRLNTGDIGYLDDAGRLWLTGRISRIVKPFGVRVSLDDLERTLSKLGSLAVCGDDSWIDIFAETGDVEEILELAKIEIQKLKLPPTLVRVRLIDTIPRSSNGKILYSGLKQ